MPPCEERDKPRALHPAWFAAGRGWPIYSGAAIVGGLLVRAWEHTIDPIEAFIKRICREVKIAPVSVKTFRVRKRRARILQAQHLWR